MPITYNIAVIGLGYVGLPLAVEFGKILNVTGYDKNIQRIKSLKKFEDSNEDINYNYLKKSKYLKFTSNINDLKLCNIYIITVPTPIKKNKKPDLFFIKQACIEVGSLLKKNDIVIFESTVYPGLTEEFCVPLLEKKSKLTYNIEFFCGYSPERINPNDKKHTLQKIIKVTSGSNKKTANLIDSLYKKIIKAGTFKVSSIKVAEAAKVIENAQRDLNIAFMNELSQIFDKLDINTNEVLRAASTKWNFLNFSPGLVGGHCIGVDPYYLTFKSIKEGYDPKIITSGREINDNFPKYIINKSIKKSINKNINIKLSKFLIVGASFKENCLDFRNSKSIDLFYILKNKNINVDMFDPFVDKRKFFNETKINLLKTIKVKSYDCIIIAVSHKIFKVNGAKYFINLLNKKGFIFDIKNIFKKNKYIEHL